MFKIQYHYPTKPWIQTQVWGIFNPFYQQFGFSLHNGLDYALGRDSLVRWPWSIGGTVRDTITQSGGGNVLAIVSDEVELMGVKCFILVDFLHLKEFKVKIGDKVKTGDIVAIGDNTGTATSGPHTHEQCRRVVKASDGSLIRLDTNQANNSFDQFVYKSGYYAEDIGSWREQLTRIALALQKIVESLKGRKLI